MAFCLRFEPADAMHKELTIFWRDEQECCSFLRFTIAHDERDLTLLISGPPAASEVLDGLRDAFDSGLDVRSPAG